jgi:8-oxo-dGTP pyrophosphatase MutT (NUDIX family)
MTIIPWKILESQYFRPRFRTDKVELPSGKVFEPTIFEFRSWANVMALTRDGQVVLVRQYRHGVQEVLYEFPGGVVEDGEQPIDGVRRELLEETGYTAAEFIQVGRLYPNPAIQTNSIYFFLALDAEEVGGQHLDEAEDIEVHLVPLDELIAMSRRGEFLHALQVAGLYQALLYLDRIR